MNRNKLRMFVLTALVTAVFAAGARPRAAFADASCSGLLTSKINQLVASGGHYSYTTTIVKDSLPYVTFQGSQLLKWDGTYLNSPDNTQFSDRYTGTQNFSVTAMESSAIWITSTGVLWIYDYTYGYWVVAGYDMSCIGGLISKYVPGLGVVTVRIGDWIPAVR